MGYCVSVLKGSPIQLYMTSMTVTFGVGSMVFYASYHYLAKGIGRQLLDVDGFRSNDGNRWRSNDESALPADDDALLHLLGWFGLCGWEEWEG